MTDNGWMINVSQILHQSALMRRLKEWSYQQAKSLKLEQYCYGLLTAAILSLLTTLNLPYQGEEAMYTISSLEMHHQKQAWWPLLYGYVYQRPPLFNWLIIPLSQVLGWSQVLLAARLITALATVATAFGVWAWITKLYKDKLLALLATTIFLSGDLLVRRGWLAYADPLFAAGVYLAIAALWCALETRKNHWFAWAFLALSAAFLSKALTAYVFYMVALFLLAWQHRHRSFLWSKASVFWHAVIAALPLYWCTHIAESSQGSGMIADIFSRITGPSLGSYFKHILLFPAEIWLRFLPASLIIAYAFISKKLTNSAKIWRGPTGIMAALILINLLPYWLSPQTRIRYILPLYPFIAIVCAVLLHESGRESIKQFLWGALACVILKYVLAWGFWPYLEREARLDYESIANDIIEETQGFSLYSDDDSAIGLSVSAHIDVLRDEPLRRPMENGQDGFVISRRENSHWGEVFRVYQKGEQKIYLLCQGRACKP